MSDWLDDLIRIEIWNKYFSCLIVFTLLIVSCGFFLTSKKRVWKLHNYARRFWHANVMLFVVYLFSLYGYILRGLNLLYKQMNCLLWV
jgi:hypothetical protein